MIHTLSETVIQGSRMKEDSDAARKTREKVKR